MFLLCPMMSYSYARLLSSPQIARTVERGGTAYTMNTAGIGARAQASVPVQAPDDGGEDEPDEPEPAERQRRALLGELRRRRDRICRPCWSVRLPIGVDAGHVDGPAIPSGALL
jgi:hypothetical protein